MKILLFLLSFSLISSLQAQVWGVPGAIWHYQFGGLILYEGTTIFRYDRDTIIDNYSAQVIESSQQFVYPGPNGPYQGPISKSLGYTRFSGDTVFWYKDNEFFPLFDIGAQTGDSLIIHNDHGASPLCDSMSILHVTASGIQTINGVDLRFIDVERGEKSNYGYNGRIYERMGSVSGGAHGYFWPNQFVCDSNVIVEYFQWQFNCYDDDTFALFSPTGTACNPYQFVSLNELHLNEKEVIKMFDAMGREINEANEGLMFIYYSDGTTEKKIQIEK